MFEAYKVGITIALTNQVSRGLLLIQRDLAKTDARAVALKTSLGQIEKMALGGAVMGGIGYALLKPLEAGYEAAKKYEQTFAQFKALNLGDAVNADADKFARASKVIGVSSEGMMAALRNMHLVVNNYKDAKMLAPVVSQMEYVSNAVGGGAFTGDQARALGKVMEWRGGFKSNEAMNAQADFMQHVMSGTSYQVMPRDYRNFLARGGAAAQQMTDEAFYYKSEPLIQMMGGQAVGAGLNTAYRRMVLGQGAGSPGGKAYLELLDRLGLVKADSIERNSHTGKITKVLPDFLKDSGLYKTDPFAFLEEKLVPALRREGMDERGIATAISQIYGRTGDPVFNQFHQRFLHGKIDSAVAIDKNAMGRDQLLKVAMASPEGAEMALGAAWWDLKNEIGHAVTPVILPALWGLRDAFKDASVWMKQHPVITGYLVKGVAALGTLLLVGGAMLVLAAGFKGLALAMQFTGVTAALRVGLTGLASTAGLAAPLVTGLGSSFLALIPALTALAGTAWLIANHQKVADWIDDHDWGRKAGDWMMNARDAIRAAPQAGNANRGGPIHTTVNIDGRKVAEAVTTHQNAGMGRPPASTAMFDGRQTLAPAGTSGAW